MPKKNKKRSARAPSRRKPPSAKPETAIVRVATPPERPWELNSEQVTLLKNYLRMGSASDMEVRAGLEVARRYKLDPFKQGQIWFIKRWDSRADGGPEGKGAFVWTPQVGIYGFLHIAARDHADYGSISEPEYGPMFIHDIEGHKVKAPEWCRVKAYKKGITEPTVATIYFEEFCPKIWKNAQSFWAPMPRNQIAKCAKAQVIRFAWPDLAGLYIPEEMERSREDYTPGGREIVNQDGFAPSGRAVTYDAQRSAADSETVENLRAKGLWCEEHHCTRSSRHLSECESSRKALIDQRGPIDAPGKPVSQPTTSLGFPEKSIKAQQELNDQKNQRHDATVPTKGKKIPESEYHPENVPHSAPMAPFPALKGTVEIDCTASRSPILRGDIAELLPSLQEKFVMEWGKDSWWHVLPGDVSAVSEMCAAQGYAVNLLPRSSGGRADTPENPPARVRSGAGTAAPAGVRPSASAAETTAKPRSSGKAESGTAAPAVSIVSGTMERSNAGMAGKYPVRQVTLVLADKTKPTYSCFDKDLFKELDGGLGKLAELVVKQNKGYWNIVGLRKIGAQEFDEDGKTRVIQRSSQEAGQRTLY